MKEVVTATLHFAIVTPPFYNYDDTPHRVDLPSLGKDKALWGSKRWSGIDDSKARNLYLE